MILKLIEKELKQADKDSWKKRKWVRYEVLIYRNDSCFKRTFIDREHGTLESPTVDEIKSYAKSSIDKVFKVTTIHERVK